MLLLGPKKYVDGTCMLKNNGKYHTWSFSWLAINFSVPALIKRLNFGVQIWHHWISFNLLICITISSLNNVLFSFSVLEKSNGFLPQKFLVLFHWSSSTMEDFCVYKHDQEKWNVKGPQCWINDVPIFVNQSIDLSINSKKTFQ